MLVQTVKASQTTVTVFTRDGFRVEGQMLSPGFSMVPGWHVTSNLTVQRYGSETDVPSADSPGPGLRGTHFFTGESCCMLSASDQMCELSAIAVTVASGGVPYQTSAYLGGVSSQSGVAFFRVRFLDSQSNPINEVLLGPVTAEDRTNRTALLIRSAAGYLPRQTRRVQSTVTTTRDWLVHGFVDNVSFILLPNTAFAECFRLWKP